MITGLTPRTQWHRELDGRGREIDQNVRFWLSMIEGVEDQEGYTSNDEMYVVSAHKRGAVRLSFRQVGLVTEALLSSPLFLLLLKLV